MYVCGCVHVCIYLCFGFFVLQLYNIYSSCYTCPTLLVLTETDQLYQDWLYPILREHGCLNKPWIAIKIYEPCNRARQMALTHS